MNLTYNYFCKGTLATSCLHHQLHHLDSRPKTAPIFFQKLFFFWQKALLTKAHSFCNIRNIDKWQEVLSGVLVLAKPLGIIGMIGLFAWTLSWWWLLGSVRHQRESDFWDIILLTWHWDRTIGFTLERISRGELKTAKTPRQQSLKTPHHVKLQPLPQAWELKSNHLTWHLQLICVSLPPSPGRRCPASIMFSLVRCHTTPSSPMKQISVFTTLLVLA